MKLLLMSIFSFVMVLSSSVHAENIGAALLDAFQCNSNDSETNKIRNSIEQLQRMVDAVEGEECKYVKTAITGLPNISNLITRIQTDNVQQQLQTLEAQVATALAEIEIVKKLPEDEKYLFPSIQSLNHIVITSRSQLLNLQSSLSVQSSEKDKQSQISGIQELNTLGENLTKALKDSSQCFKGDNSVLKKQSLIALAGIAGYFMEAPLGVATTWVAKNVQNLVSVFGDRQQNARRRMAQSSDQLDLGFGFGCAVEKLSNQHCNLIKKEKLLSKLKDQNKTEAESACMDCDNPNPHILSRQASQDLSIISDWVNQKESSGGSSDHERQRIRDQARNKIINETNSIMTNINYAISDAGKYLANEQNPKKKKLKDAGLKVLQDFMNLLKSNGESTGDLAYAIQGDISENELESTVFKLLLGDAGSEVYEEISLAPAPPPAPASAPAPAPESAPSAPAPPAPESAPAPASAPPPPPPPASASFGGFGGSGVISRLTNLMSDPKPINGVTKLRQMLSEEETLKAMVNRVKRFQTSSINRLKTELSAGDKNELADQFITSKDPSQRSVKESLTNVHSYLEFAEDYLQYSFSRDSVSSLKEKVNTAIESANSGITNRSAESIIDAMNTLVGDNIEFSEDVTRVVEQVQKHHIRNLSELGAEGVNTHSQEIIWDALNITTNTALSDAEKDVTEAKEYSLKHMKAFSGFLLSKNKQIEDLLEDGFEDEKNKNRFCVRLIGLTDLNVKTFKDIKNQCAGRKITDPKGKELTFDSMVDKPLEQRVCALQMFKDNMDRPEPPSTQ